MKHYLAIDIGASSGRHILGTVRDGKITLEEVYRFDNGQVRKDGHDCWDIEKLVESVKEIGARDALVATGKEIRDHQTSMDLFLLSANAITSDGVIVNIDGTGNRIAASIYGPKRVVYVIGRNKVVNGGLLEAIARAKRCACPPNCRRLNKKTPCADLGVCADCDSPDRICKVTAFFDRAPTRTPTKVILVDEDLGY